MSASAHMMHRKQQALSSFSKVKIEIIPVVETDSPAPSPRGQGREFAAAAAAANRMSVHAGNPPPPLVDQKGELWSPRESLCGECGVAAVQGRRPYMEDRHLISVCPTSQIRGAFTFHEVFEWLGRV